MLRSRINKSVPWFGTSATLDPDTLREVKILAEFDETTCVQKTSIDRPEIQLTIKPLEYPANSFRDLEFFVNAAQIFPQASTLREPLAGVLDHTLIDQTELQSLIRANDLTGARALLERYKNESLVTETIRRLQQKQSAQAQRDRDSVMLNNDSVQCYSIPKTIIYMESIQEMECARTFLINCLLKAGIKPYSVCKAIQVYYADLADYDKRRISAEFATIDLRIRIILATDALGIGVNNPNIARVVQYKVPKDMKSLYQRAGRVARARGATGEFLWLVEPWVFGPRLEEFKRTRANPRVSSLSQSQCTDMDNSFEESGSEAGSDFSISARLSQGAMAEREAKRRSNLPKGMWRLLNMKRCLRRIILEFFNEDLSNFEPPPNCCSRCNGTQLEPRLNSRVRYIQSNDTINQAVRKSLMEWRTMRALQQFENMWISNPGIILPDSVLKTLARGAPSIEGIDSF